MAKIYGVPLRMTRAAPKRGSCLRLQHARRARMSCENVLIRCAQSLQVVAACGSSDILLMAMHCTSIFSPCFLVGPRCVCVIYVKTFVYHVSVYIWEMKCIRTSSRQTEQQSVAKGKVEIATGNAKITHTQCGATMLNELCLQLQGEGREL